MKKLAILFLLTTVLIGGVFAEASVTAQFVLGNINEGDGYDFSKEEGGGEGQQKGANDPKLQFFFVGSGTQEVGPGALTFGLQLVPFISFNGDTGDGAGVDLGEDNYVWAGYAFAAGPGTLDFTLKIFANNVDGLTWEPNVAYNGLVAGPATLGFGAFYDFKTTGNDKDATSGDFIKQGGPFAKEGVGGSKKSDNDDDIGLWVTAAFDFGLNVKYQFVYGIGMGEIKNIAYLDVNYDVMEAFNVGVTLDNTGSQWKVYKEVAGQNKAGGLFEGFSIKPYASYVLSENMSVGAFFKIANISGYEDTGMDNEMQMTPGVWFKYAL